MAEMQRRVLVVEDDVLETARITETVRRSGCLPVLAAGCAGEHLRPMLATVHAVIIDQHLAAGPGELLVRLAQASADERLAGIPFIGISERAGDEQALMEAGACCFLSRPVDPYRLARAIFWATEVYWRDDTYGARKGWSAFAPVVAARLRTRRPA